MTTYLCTYWNHQNDPLRKQLTQEFCDRYPWITLLQVGNDIISDNTVIYSDISDGFVDYTLINKYLSNNTVYNLVIIDADLILQDNFRQLMSDKLVDFEFVHGFNYTFELKDGKESYFAPSFYSKKSGHTGFIQGYSNSFLQKIEYKFMTNFLIGGFDYVLACVLTDKSLDWCSSFTFYQHLVEFANKIKGSTYTNLDHLVVHCYHGDQSSRLTPFKLYNKELNLDWLKIRNSCC